MDHLIDDEELPRHERELTLSTGAILGIFLGLAVLCGGFFGFGYNMGRKSAPTPLNLSDVAADPSLSATNGAGKPSAGSPLDESTTTTTPVPAPAPKPTRHPAAPTVDDASDRTAERATVPADVPKTPRPTTTPSATAAVTSAPVVRQPAPVPPSALNPSATGTGTGSYMVQVAAVSHQEDADLLVGALRSRGYAVSARPSGADSFIHVQIGPFRDKKEADAMKQRLLTDGYNAIVK